MGIRTKTWIAIVTAGLALETWAFCVVSASPDRWRASMIVRDDPVAHTLYEVMCRMIRESNSLSYTSTCSGPDGRTSIYRVGLKKPNAFRVEVSNDITERGSLVCDGNNLWIAWADDRAFLSTDDQETYEKNRSRVYIRKPFAGERDSLADEMGSLGLAWFGPIWDPSLFYGRDDPLEPCIDGIRSRGIDRLGDEECEVIEVSYMKAQRTRYFWISKRDYFPRRVKEITRLIENRVTVEDWSEVTANPEIPSKLLAWTPPEGWRGWSPRKAEETLLKVGQAAPDFAAILLDNSAIRLSDFRGRVVWLYVWQMVSPQFREEMGTLQLVYERYRDEGLVLLAVNDADDPRIARVLLQGSSFSFPIGFHSDVSGPKALSDSYGDRTGRVPLNIVIDRQGSVADGWYGCEEGHGRALAALQKLGLRSDGR